VAVAIRLPVTLQRAGGWRGTTLPMGPGPWTNVLTGQPVPSSWVAAEDLLQRYPVALLVRGDQ
jgi:(1->4)-alpha-D-glucan 1-alpha-D-glucosylmutase